MAVILLMLAVAAFAYRYPVFYGYRFIGNSDRWDQYLMFAQFHADALAAGSFTAWSQNLLGGFDTLDQAFGFFTPLFMIAPLLHMSDVVAVFGYVDMFLLAATLVIAYLVILQFTHDRVASIAGAFIYACSTYSLLKLAQSDLTFLSILVAPILFHLVHNANQENRFRTMALVAAITGFCLYAAFLQELSYVFLFLLLYAGWRAARGNYEGLLALVIGLTGGFAIALPRLVAEYQTLGDTARAGAGVPRDFSTAMLLRFFSRDIFGRSYSENLFGNRFNLYEGDLLFATVFASLLLVGIAVDRGRRAATPWMSLRRADIWFLIAYILFVFGAMHVEVVYRIVSLMYGNRPFQHSRIAVSALLPIALLSALYLRRREGRQLNVASWVTVGIAMVIVVAATTFDYQPWRDPILHAFGQSRESFIQCGSCLDWVEVTKFLAVDVIRFATLAVLLLVILASQRLLPWFAADGVRVALALGIAFQAAWGANVWLSGPDLRNQTAPFEGNNLVLAPPDNFTPPTADEVRELKAELDNDAYRSITICDPGIIRVECSNPMGLGWNLRLLDGYLSGIPRRLAALPWNVDHPAEDVSLEVSVRLIRFNSVSSVPWRLMSLLNVRDALVVSPELYSNEGSQLPPDLKILHNPSPYVYPRAYFAQTVESVSEAEDVSRTRGFFGTCKTCTRVLTARKPVDEVEGPVMGAFDDSGDLVVSGGGDRLEVSFPPSAKQRFLVLNEMYAPGWSASADGRDLAVYPTNVVLRGVLVPPGSEKVTFEYHSFFGFAAWYTAALAILVAAAVVALRHGDRLRRLLGGG
jgi:hypothetical protein